MRRSTLAILIIAIVLCTLGIAMLVGALRAQQSDTVPIHENGTIEVTFCPECKQQLESLIAGGGELHCAIYDVGKIIGSQLEEAGAHVITDDETKAAYGTPYVASGLMHHKFCVINGSIVVTGSYNPTDKGELNTNNLVTITSQRLAQNYEREFQSLSTKRKRGAVQHTGTISGVPVENYFCPKDACEDQVLRVLSAATSEVRFMTFSFTSDPIGDLLVKKQEAGVFVEGMCEPSQLNPYNECERLGAREWNGPSLLHHKVFIIDRAVVVTGSYNPTGNGNRVNNENILIIHSPEIAKAFLQEYDRLWATAG